MRERIAGKRILVLGAETGVGRAVVERLAEAGARVAAVAATSDADAAFAVQRLARRTGAVAQAIEATNEMAVRVMVRQVAKEMGGIEAVVFVADPGGRYLGAIDLARRLGEKEMSRTAGGPFLAASGTLPADEAAADVFARLAEEFASG